MACLQKGHVSLILNNLLSIKYIYIYVYIYKYIYTRDSEANINSIKSEHGISHYVSQPSNRNAVEFFINS